MVGQFSWSDCFLGLAVRSGGLPRDSHFNGETGVKSLGFSRNRESDDAPNGF